MIIKLSNAIFRVKLFYLYTYYIPNLFTLPCKVLRIFNVNVLLIPNTNKNKKYIIMLV